MESTPNPEVQRRIQALVDGAPVVLFMKGQRTMPRCGFSAEVVARLDRHLAEYATVDVLADPELREGIKAYAQWPTIPQLYVRGEFLGGCDIVTEMDESGELAAALAAPAGRD